MTWKRLGVASALMVLGAAMFGTAGRAGQSTGGAQFLDGIGETALVARYVFDGNAEDWSRNALHASLVGTGARFVEDSRFGRVLSLAGDGSAVRLPGGALTGEDTLSVTGWFNLQSTAAGQTLFFFGRNVSSRLDAVIGSNAVLTSTLAAGASAVFEARGGNLPTQQWAHVAVVLDPADRTLSLYLNGERVAQVTNVSANAEQIIDQTNESANQLYLGRSPNASDPSLNARVADVRIYRIALTPAQVATIYRNAGAARTSAGAGDAATAATAPTTSGADQAASAIVSVSDVTVETTEGFWPRLPYYVPAVYRNGDGPPVRVIWPAPTDNSQVRQVGTITVTGKVPGTPLEVKATVHVRPAAQPPVAPSRTVEPFPLDRVTLNKDLDGRDTPFMKNRDKFIQGLAATNPDRFLYMFRDAFGQPQPEGAEPLGGWDNQTTKLRGHATGHYLTALAQAYASLTYDPELREQFHRKMDYMIDVLYDLSQKSGKPAQEGGPSNADPTAVPPGPGREGYDSDLRAGNIRTDYWNWGVGFISAYPPDQFILLEQGATYGSRNDQVWAPYYTLHKILAGLLDCYEVGGNPKALEIAKGMGAWVYARLRVLPVETRISMWNRYIAGEYGGMNEVMARLYRLTNDRQYLECAKLFDNISFFFGDADHTHGLAKNIDTIRGKHANQHIPQITGALETYRNTRETPYYLVADNFFDKVTHSYMYSIGGVAGARNPNNAECFTAQPDTLATNGFAQGGQNETCATYNMLKLSRQLFTYQPDAKYMDYYERGMFNHILASVAENNPGNTYHVPLNPGAQKRFGNANMSGFTCCNGTALESHTKLQDSIYFRSGDDRTLYVNLYVPSTLNWTERNIVLEQRTNFPYADTTRLVLARGGGEFDLKVRVPYWATRGFFVKINGEDQSVQARPGSYLTLQRTWKEGDTVELRMPFSFHLDPVMDQPNIASIFYGPVLLAAEEPAPRTDWRPIRLDASDIGKSITGDPATLRFSIDGVTLKPFFETYGRYSVYFNVSFGEAASVAPSIAWRYSARAY